MKPIHSLAQNPTIQLKITFQYFLDSIKNYLVTKCALY